MKARSPVRTLRSSFRFLVWIVVGRLLIAIPLVVLAASLIFLAVALLPGDLASEILGREAQAEAITALRHQLGLDQPLIVRYVNWLSDLVHGDFGRSLASGRPISQLLGPRLFNTLFLAGLTSIIAIPLAFVLGILAALWRHSAFDRIASGIALSGISLPDFFVAYVFIFFFSVQLPIFPSIANIDTSTPIFERIWRALLPALTLTMLITAPMMRMTRAAIINTLSSAYIEMCHLKGVPPLVLILRHALPNVIAPIVTVIMFNLGYLVVGVVIIEVVFAYPGMGQLLVDAVSKRDVPVVQACALAFSATYITLNMIADTVSLASDPRRLSTQREW